MTAYDDWKLASPREDEDAEEDYPDEGYSSTQMCQTPQGECLDPEYCSGCPYYRGDQ